ncbi:MAG: chromosome segregation protein SMC [Deltaproteobacteria bacterium]|nr:chromosome segregation protein SMC [Deltaproteobacteria bacterium]
MKLKKLELIGFKSFYDKTTFDFSDGITAIVGPNGCGKSNIVDAIRWVLGEHAPSHLRSKALEDVIFAGSDAAGPLGMAEVTLTFVNDDGIAPPGFESFSEISVTRRTFRDGESEFYINKTACRLKDISELFLDTGAGARGYAIIQQGKVGEIVNARPEEKRLIIEEAAGVAKFRVRRKEAERKMESTRQNLARVRDILDEVRRQIGSLERQVRKAERYKALRAELKKLDLRVAAGKHREMAAELEASGKELLAVDDVLIACRSRASALDADREEALVRRAERERLLGDLREEHARRKEEAARKEAEWNGLLAQADHFRRTVDETGREMQALQAEIEELDGRLLRDGEESLLRRDELARARARWEEGRTALASTREEYLRVQEKADRATSDLMVRVTQHSGAQSGAEALSRRIEEGERGLARLSERIGEAAAAVEKASAEYESAVAAEREAFEALAAAERSWAETGVLLAGTTSRLDASVDESRRAEGALQAAESRLSTLSRVHEQRDWTSSGVRAVLHHFRNGGAKDLGAGGIFGIMGDLIETGAEYEKAVEAVLGERMQSVVVRDHADGLCAINYLKESREGRSAFVPVGLRIREEQLAHVEEDGVVGPLTSVVQAPPECGDLVRGLLGGTLLVRNLDTALRLWNRNGVWNSYVTLDGEVVTADGILIGGEQGGARETVEGEEVSFDAGILARRREMRQLSREIEDLRRLREGRLEEEEAIRRTRAGLEERLSGMFRARENAGSAHAAAVRTKAVLEETLAQARALLDGRMQEEAFLRGELKRMTDDLDASLAAARETEQARGEEEERSRGLLSELETSRRFLEECRELAHAAEIACSGLEEKDRAAALLLASLAEQAEGKRRLLAERGRRKTEYEESLVAIDAGMLAGREAIEKAAIDLSGLQERIEERVADLALSASRLSSIEEELRQARARESEGMERQSAERLRQQRVAMDIQALDALVHQRYEVRLGDLPQGDAEEGAGEAGDIPELAERAEACRERMSAMGEVNLASLEEHGELTERHAFLTSQKDDLERSLDDLAKAILRINRTTRERFSNAFDEINGKFAELFPRLFQGGRAQLRLLEEENLLESGVEIFVQLPGKKALPLHSLSGGESALTAISLIFSIFLVKPSPFCLLDEVDAPLDDANVDRFNGMVREMSSSYQFLLITHNKRTMELADVLYGITMEKPGISKTVSVKLS